VDQTMGPSCKRIQVWLRDLTVVETVTCFILCGQLNVGAQGPTFYSWTTESATGQQTQR
jgi:hypothetical protein